MLVATTLCLAWCAAERVAHKVKAPCMMANKTNAAKVIISRVLIMQLAYWINKHLTILICRACGLTAPRRLNDGVCKLVVCFIDLYMAARNGEQQYGFCPCRPS